MELTSPQRVKKKITVCAFVGGDSRFVTGQRGQRRRRPGGVDTAVVIGRREEEPGEKEEEEEEAEAEPDWRSR